ncbi:dynein axonemal intermediate chain 7-like [Cololabis saira]|uniref:dynein axonemal intermediate chain 7-like n=1 Tax=Cololabis saira TaxID=129043 RepID=UPI002AD3060E|nr:dynein axonemal intermediate chain 7-like [Cololabis saira]
MPDKKEKPNKKGKPKLTKAQKKQQLKEEKRRREEEEARLQAEREEQERLERERKQEEIERLELKDQERREDELNELRHLLEENHAAVTKWKRDAEETAEWDRYMRCDGVPDPRVQREINTFISLWRDDPDVNITQVLKQCNTALQLVEGLEGLLEEVTDSQKAERYQKDLVNLQELIQAKLDQSTDESLQNASKNVDDETGNMQTVVKDDNITLCLWANLKMSPRFKGFNFEGVGLGFELPKQLAVSSIAVRMCHTRYDHLSMLARITHPAIHTPSRRSLVGSKEYLESEDTTVHEETKENESVVGEDDAQQRRVDDEVQSIKGSEGQKSATSLRSRRSSSRSRRSSSRSRKSSSQPSEGRRSQILTQIEVVSAENDLIGSQLTKSACNKVIDLMQYTPLGGVFYCGMFHLPPQAQCVNGWEFRQILDTGLEVFPYPAETSNLDNNEPLTCPPVGVSVKLPDCVIFLETPQVARWDAEGTQWKTDGITDVSFEEAEAKISFKMESFQPFVLLQETYANLPFQSWELRPLGQDSALFTINGALINLSITIKDNQCMLQSEQERGPSHLLGKWMSGPALQRAMINAGINIFVNEHSDRYVSICDKDPLTEHAAYEQMALFASACAFSWSKWNAKSGTRDLVMQVCEHYDATPIPEDSWTLYLLAPQRSKKLELTEKCEGFSPDHYPGSEFHSTLIHILQDDMSPDAVARTRKSHHLFVDTVHRLLCATRPLVYSI